MHISAAGVELSHGSYAQRERHPVADVVVLAGTAGRASPSAQSQLGPTLPLPGTTLIEALIDRLADAIDGRFTVCTNLPTDLVERHLAGRDSVDHDLEFVRDAAPRGSAGCLKACEARVGGRPILLAGGSVWLEDDPRWMVEQHLAQGNALTVFCTREAELASVGGETLLTPSGVYCCDPIVLNYIRTHAFQDLKEQLIPALQRAGLRVGTVTLQNHTCEVSDWSTYQGVLGRLLSSGEFDTEGYERIAPDIWCGVGVEIAADARVAGPALLGHRCRIESSAVVVGPTLLGDDCHVGQGAWLLRVATDAGVQVGPGSSATDRVLHASPYVPGSRRQVNHADDGLSKVDAAIAGMADSNARNWIKGKWMGALVPGALVSLLGAWALWRGVAHFLGN